MNITFDELRKIKHQLPTGGVAKIAAKLKIDEQTVRNYFGAQKFENGELVGNHIQPGPDGGIVHIEDTTIHNAAKELITKSKTAAV
jgi:hypothetical protein